MILSNLTIPLLGVVDTAILGHLSDATYLGAVALGAIIFDMLFWAFGFLRMGTTGIIAQANASRRILQTVLRYTHIRCARRSMRLCYYWLAAECRQTTKSVDGCADY